LGCGCGGGSQATVGLRLLNEAVLVWPECPDVLDGAKLGLLLRTGLGSEPVCLWNAINK